MVPVNPSETAARLNVVLPPAATLLEPEFTVSQKSGAAGLAPQLTFGLENVELESCVVTVFHPENDFNVPPEGTGTTYGEESVACHQLLLFEYSVPANVLQSVESQLSLKSFSEPVATKVLPLDER